VTDQRPSGPRDLPEILLRRLLRLRDILTPEFFSLSESIWERVSGVCLLLFLFSLLVIGAFVSVRIESIRLLSGVETLDRFVRSNPLIVTDSNMTDAFAILALLTAFSGLPAGIYSFLNTGEPTALYVGTTVTIVLLYIAAYLLNPTILNIWISNEASIGDNGVTFLSILNGIGPARLARLAYGIAMLNGFLMFAHGILEKLAASSIADTFSAQDIWTLGLVGSGALVIVIAVVVPLPLFLYIIIIHALLDALSSLIRVKNLRKPRSGVQDDTRPL
jgi:hypothetical protein